MLNREFEILPASFRVDNLRIVRRDDSGRLFVYWEIKSETVQFTLDKVKEPVPVLRVFYQTKSQTRFYDERIVIAGRRHHLHVCAIGQVTRVSLGFRSLNCGGSFISALSVDKIETTE